VAIRELVAKLPRLRVQHLPRSTTATRAAATADLDELSRDAPRKVLVFSPDLLPLPGFPTVGSGLRAWGLGQGLRSRGHDVVFSMPRVAVERVRARYAIPPEVDALAWEPWKMHKMIERVEPDVALVCGWALADGLRQNPLLAVPVVLDQHGPHVLERRYQKVGDLRGNAWQKVAALASADYFSCAGDRQLEYFQPWLSAAGWSSEQRRVRSLAMRFSLPPDPPERHPDDELTFVYGGVWLPWQDPTAGLLALVRQLDRRGHGKLRLFGGRHPWIEIEGGAFEKLVSTIEQSPHVVHEGQLSHGDLIGRYTRAHVALDLMQRTPERELAFTSRTAEFLWCGLPVIYNDYSELSELIRDYDAGWTVDPADAAAIDAAIDEVFDDPAAVARKSENARTLAREQLDWSATIDPLDRIVRAATPRPGARPIPNERRPSALDRARWVARREGPGAAVNKGIRVAVRRLGFRR